MGLAALVLLFSAVGIQSSPAPASQSVACKVSPTVRDTAPPDSSADPMGPARWYINADRTIWAGPVPDEGWSSGGTLFSGSRVVKGQKTYWVRPQGTELVITGRRLDASAPSVEADIPCCYRTGFQVVGLFLPTEGCWEVTANAGPSQLTFVTRVKAPAGRPLGNGGPRGWAMRRTMRRSAQRSAAAASQGTQPTDVAPGD